MPDDPTTPPATPAAFTPKLTPDDYLKMAQDALTLYSTLAPIIAGFVSSGQISVAAQNAQLATLDGIRSGAGFDGPGWKTDGES